eukprot:PhF_6_TR17352/c0_g1_i2/m.26576/K18932/ZDHHC; palmitoyltransferase
MMDPGYLPMHPIDEEQLSSSASSYFCETCNLHRPLRTKHCRKCGRCVAMYDHHCYWLFTCVGSRNRGLFVLHVFLLGITTAWGTSYVYDTILPYNNSFDAYILTNFFQLIAAITGTLFTLFLVGLWLGHVVLISHGQTSYEFGRPHKIEYMKEHRYDNPFDYGVVRNWVYLLWSRTSPTYRWKTTITPSVR